jgi:prepilin-type processing-associated H-X9-DG protein
MMGGPPCSRARKANCCSNLRQLSSAFSLYADDNGNSVPLNYTQSTNNYPNGDPCDPSHGNAWLWMHYTCRYVRSYRVYNCPTSLGGTFTGSYYWIGGKQDPDPPFSSSGATFFNASYGYNRWLGRYYFEQRVTFSTIARAGRTPLLGDCYYYLMGPQYNADGYHNDFPPKARHNAMVNMAFADGHAKAVKRSDWITSNPRSSSDPVWRNWDPLL